MSDGNPQADKVIAECEQSAAAVKKAREGHKQSQDTLRGLLSTHNLLGNVLSDEQVSRIQELAPEKKKRAPKGEKKGA